MLYSSGIPSFDCNIIRYMPSFCITVQLLKKKSITTGSQHKGACRKRSLCCSSNELTTSNLSQAL